MRNDQQFSHCDLVRGCAGTFAPSARTVAYRNVNSTQNTIIKCGRANYFANCDFSPPQSYGDDCLLQQVAA
jgi:hypothetical protein